MPSHRSALLAAALLATVLVGAVAAGLTTASAAAAQSDGVSFDQSTYRTVNGDTVTVSFAVPAGSEATLWLQRTTNAVTSRADVRDGGDGRVTVVLDTTDGTWTVVSADDRLVDQEPNPDRPVRPTAYQLTVGTEDDAAFARLDVESTSLERLTTWRAPNRSVPLESASEIRDAIERDEIERAERLTATDTLVLELDAPGLAGALAAAPGENVTARFRHVFATTGGVRLEQTNPPPERQTLELDVVNASGVRVLPDHTNDTYFVTIDLARATVQRGDDPVDDADFEDVEFEATVHLDGDTTWRSESARADAFVSPRGVRVQTAPDHRVHLAAAPNRTVGGTTTVGTGWNVTVVVRGVDDPDTDANESFVERSTTTVTRAPDHHAANAFDATLNLSGATPGTDATVDVHFDGRSLLDEPIPVRIERPTASLTEVSVEREASRTTLEAVATLDRGGFVVLHATDATGPVVGTSRYLGPGEHEVSIEVREPTDASDLVAVVHADENENGTFDGPDDAPYGDAIVTIANPSATTTRTTEPTNRSTTTVDSTTAGGTTREGTDAVAVPGPGFLGGLLAVLGGALLAIRRDALD